jgi:hypothetical protein
MLNGSNKQEQEQQQGTFWKEKGRKAGKAAAGYFP